jgi:hypothetical protein
MSTKSEVRKHRCRRLSNSHDASIMYKESYAKKVVGTSGVWGLPSSNTHAVPTGFCSDCQLDNIRNKSYRYLVGSVEQEPYEIEGHDMQRCLLDLYCRFERTKIDSIRDFLGQLLATEEDATPWELVRVS